MAFVDYDYHFLAADVGVQGQISYAGVLQYSAMYFALENNKLNLLNPSIRQQKMMKVTYPPALFSFYLLQMMRSS